MSGWTQEEKKKKENVVIPFSVHVAHDITEKLQTC